ncbi:MAG TPA: HD domain-containing protein [Verrucomicrobiae bacterium]|jgi:hypothetical protein
MTDPVRTNDPAAVRAAVLDLFRAAFPGASVSRLEGAFARAADCFSGRYAGYHAIDAHYHDFEHTLQGTLCLARMLHGRHQAGAKPPVPHAMFELAIIAALLHDTGYLKTTDDREGTGAKYTLTHVNRSAEFAARLLGELGFPAAQIGAVQNMIRCTGVSANLGAIPFQDEIERTLGLALGTADLLGQMAAADYPTKLPLLYDEFAESARFNGKPGAAGNFADAADLIARTPAFWDNYVLPKIEKDFAGLYRFLSQPYPSGPNAYLDRIETNIARIRRQIAA